MPVMPGLTVAIPARTVFFRITSANFRPRDRRRHRLVVNGEGAVLSRNGARYNYPGARTVYLAESLETVLAERLYYFQRDILRELDAWHITHVFPVFEDSVVLWLDFEASEVRLGPPAGGTLPPVLGPFANWTRVDFNH